ncbi:hypothetical protein [Pseudodesulfovibrio karagichevae]|uniref:Uncharacterized protein n=1 Tax=Pseudodesulfovibrio karagichevae TaxID=3239305 RepID=A0ABV4K2B6_9BACT
MSEKISTILGQLPDEIVRVVAEAGYENDETDSWTKVLMSKPPLRTRTRVSIFWSRLAAGLVVTASVMDLAEPDMPSMKVRWDFGWPDAEDVATAINRLETYFEGP